MFYRLGFSGVPMLRFILAVAIFLAAGGAHAQALISGTAPAPLPSNIIPSSEAIGGAIGSDVVMYATANHQHPRITRATTCTLDSNGACTITWASALSSAPTIAYAPINTTAVAPVVCNLTAVPTTTTVSLKCWTSQTTLLSLSIVTTGLTLNPFAQAVAGTQIQIIALPPTQ